ncbi:substrate-binding periplasmic protein [Hahella ganghwensis]|uniref:substrate-binding periplasmic protein n=1 Tax=Hahella ganghwensis TaxID=286420 RepID=UPI0003A38340|nr:transporter substrate-binding domain-containing protein [Hahella ganghwensis]
MTVSSAIAHDKIVFYLEDEPIYTSSNNQSPGFLNEVVAALIDDLKLAPEVHYLPWIRAQYMVQKDPLGIIFPLGRTKTREEQYQWLCKVFDIPIMFISIQGRPVINSFKEARDFRGIGVIQGTPQEERLSKLNIPYVPLTGEELYSALETGYVTAIFTAQPEAVYGWKQLGNGKKLQFGEVLMTLPLWISASRQFELLAPKQWEEALDKLKASGKYEKLYQHYFNP